MNITIVGGGTAGWIAAFYITKAQPNVHKITVIESSKLGIIGAGEGSTGLMLDLLTGTFFDFKVDIDQFVQETDGTNKMGIKFVNWDKDASGSFFEPLDVSPSGFSTNDYIFKYVFSKAGTEFMHVASKLGVLYDNKIYDKYSAFHFDGHKVGMFFKKECEKDGVKVIDAVVDEVILDKNGFVESIVLDNNQTLTSDLFIDCTGFNRVLMSKVGTKWVSKSQYLPLNTAMPFLIQYEPGQEFIPQTTSTALSSGWMWDIPLRTRRGCGYVFDKNFITKEQAQEEIEQHLGQKIKPIKFIDFESGYVDKFWNKNVLALGLSSSFFEPLEATSIHNTIVQVSIFVDEFLLPDVKRTIKEENEHLYNRRIVFLNELTADFISSHYQGGRQDSPFWRNITNNIGATPNISAIINRAKTKIPGWSGFEGMYGSFSIPLLNWVLAGLGIITKEQAYKELEETNSISCAAHKYKEFYETFY